jgi:glyoxylase-like metal-dependent hydrolase (beta-lactamase superfamily II)
MIVRQFLHYEPAIAASYLVGCAGHGVAAVVDPVDPPATYLALAASLGVRIHYVVDTHLHADHLSTGRPLAQEAGAPYVLHESADVDYAFHAARDDAHLDLGNVTLRVVHLPGHTPEHLGLVVTDRTRAARPWLVLTGHTLMVGDMGRTELATSAEDGARALFDSARKLRELPDDVMVLPGAFSGSVCGRGLSATPFSTIGFERHANRAFSIEDAAGFLEYMRANVPSRPPDADLVRAKNRGRSTPSAAPA